MGFNNENVAISLPTLTVSAAWGSAEAASSLPKLTQSALGGAIWSASSTLPNLASTTGNLGGFNNSVELPLLQSEGSGVSGGTGTADVILPRLRSAAYSDDVGAADIELPLLTSRGSGYENIVFAADTTIPLLQMSATWEAVLAELFTVWVMEAESKGVSTYTEFNYNSYAERGGVHYGANANGIYRLNADTDAGADIDAQLLYAPTDFFYEDFGLKQEEATRQKRMASLYLMCRNDGDLKMLVKVDEDEYREYTIDSTTDPQGMHNRRVVVGRGLKGLLWQLGVANVDGSDFEAAALKAYPIVTSRRVV